MSRKVCLDSPKPSRKAQDVPFKLLLNISNCSSSKTSLCFACMFCDRGVEMCAKLKTKPKVELACYVESQQGSYATDECQPGADCEMLHLFNRALLIEFYRLSRLGGRFSSPSTFSSLSTVLSAVAMSTRIG